MGETEQQIIDNLHKENKDLKQKCYGLGGYEGRANRHKTEILYLERELAKAKSESACPPTPLANEVKDVVRAFESYLEAPDFDSSIAGLRTLQEALSRLTEAYHG